MGRGLALRLRESGATHVHATWSNHIADIARFSAEATGLPWSFAAHARDVWVEGGDLQAKLASARFATACTRAGAARLGEFGSNVLYQPHGLEIERYPWHEWRGDDDGEMRLLGVGRLVPKKGWDDAIAAATHLSNAGHRVHLTLVGDGPLRERLQRSVPPGLDVHFDGALSHADVVAAMVRANGFVLPSRITPDGDRDGLANVLLEAAAVGLPLVTTDAGSARDFVDDATGWLCPSGDPHALAATMERVWQHGDETRRRCLNARRRVEERFDAAVNVQSLLEAFQGADTSLTTDNSAPRG